MEVPQAATQALDIALRHTSAMNPSCQVFNRSFFWHDPSRIHSLGGGAEVTASVDSAPTLLNLDSSDCLTGAAFADKGASWLVWLQHFHAGQTNISGHT